MAAIRRPRRQDSGQLGKALDADLWRSQAHAGAIGLVEHPVRQFPREVWPFLRVYRHELDLLVVRRRWSTEATQASMTRGCGRIARLTVVKTTSVSIGLGLTGATRVTRGAPGAASQEIFELAQYRVHSRVSRGKSHFQT